MSEAHAPKMRGTLSLFFAAAAFLSLLVGLAVAVPDYLPTNDGPEHVFASHALRHLDDASLGYSRYLKPGATFSHTGFDLLFGSLESMAGWRSGLRASLVVMALFWAWGVVAFAAAVGGRPRMWLGLLGFAAAVQWQLYMGFFPFYLATGLGFYLLALAVWQRRWTWRWQALLAAGLAAQALIHPVPAMCTGLGVVLVRAWHAEKATVVREAWIMALVALPAALVAYASRDPLGADPETIFLSWSERATLAVTAFVSGPLWRSLPIPLCALGAAVLATFHRQWRSSRLEGALLTAGLLFALLATQGPHHVAGWQFFNMRFAPLAAFLWLALLPVERLTRRARIAGVVALVVFAAGSNLWALGYGLRLRDHSADLLAGLDLPIRRQGLRLPLIVEPRAGEPQNKSERTVPYGTANWNIGSIYAVAQGGVPAWTFAELEKLHAVVWRWPERQGLRPPRPERGFEWALSEPDVLSAPDARKAGITRLLSYAPYYEDVIFYGRPEELALLRERRFAIDYERGGLAIARFQACPTTVDFAPAPHGHSRTIVYFGWSPSTEQAFSLTLPAIANGQTPRSWRVDECPCGDIWLRVLFDNDGDGRLSAGDSTCVEASAQGVMGAHIEPGESRISCHPGRVLP